MVHIIKIKWVIQNKRFEEINKGGVVQNYQQKYLHIRLFYF